MVKMHNIINSLIEENGMIKLKMTGYSMFPFLKPGHYGIVVKVTPDKLKIGDIVVFSQNDHFIAHRLIGISEDRFICKGDAMKFSDVPVLPHQILGKLIAVEKKNKTVQLDTPKAVRVANCIVKFNKFYYYRSRLAMKLHFLLKFLHVVRFI